MKKLMIAAAIVCAAAMSQAAAVSWNSGALTDSKGQAVGAKNLITGYLWEISPDDYAIYVAMDSVTLSQTVGAAFEAGDLGQALNTAGNNWTSRAGASLNLKGADTWSANDTAYGLLLYYDVANEMYLANVAEAPFTSPQDITIGEMANIRGGADAAGGATAWAAVPEPTSGLLLLLGVAGLALRRRRA